MKIGSGPMKLNDIGMIMSTIFLEGRSQLFN